MPFNQLVVLMLENRSFDNMLGFAYDRANPPKKTSLNQGQMFYGLDFDATGMRPGDRYWNPSNHNFFSVPPADPVKVFISPATDFTMPHPDPGEHFDRITAQIFGPDLPAIESNSRMLGFLLDFAESAGSSNRTRAA